MKKRLSKNQIIALCFVCIISISLIVSGIILNTGGGKKNSSSSNDVDWTEVYSNIEYIKKKDTSDYTNTYYFYSNYTMTYYIYIDYASLSVYKGTSYVSKTSVAETFYNGHYYDYCYKVSLTAYNQYELQFSAYSSTFRFVISEW